MKHKGTETDRVRIEKDSLGELAVPKDALWGAQTERAIENFPIGGLRLQRPFIRALGMIKAAAAKVNVDLNLLKPEIGIAIIDAAESVAEGLYDEHFPLDVFQTGSGTSTNMNANEVIARLAFLRSNHPVHPNDDVNMCQSSNDVIPTAIHVSSSLQIHEQLLPALHHLASVIQKREKELEHVVKTGRTHLMDAVPLTFGQELSGFSAQIHQSIARIESLCPIIQALAIGGTAVGTGLNAHPEFGNRVVIELSNATAIPFSPHVNYFAALSSQTAIVELSGVLKTLAISLTKISNDLRLMNSGPLSGLAEISLPALQPGSSIMPGKINPVIPEAVMMASAQIIGNDTTITLGGLGGNFQLNTMLPVIAYNILQSLELSANCSRLLADKAVADFVVQESHIDEVLSKNPILVTALNPVLGYEKCAEIAKRAYREKRSIREVAKEMTELAPEEIDRLLDPKNLTQGGILS